MHTGQVTVYTRQKKKNIEIGQANPGDIVALDQIRQRLTQRRVDFCCKVTSESSCEVFELDMNEVDKILAFVHGNLWKSVIDFYMDKMLNL